MSVDFEPWTERSAATGGELRDQRSGLPGFGGRPVLHPAWRDPAAGSDRPRASRASTAND